MTTEHEHKMRVWEKETEHKMRVWEKETERHLQAHLHSFSAVIDFATLSIKSLLLFNGGAIIALLTFYGNVLSKSDSAQIISAHNLSNAIGFYIIGVGTGLFCSMSAYFTQVLFSELSDERKAIRWGNSFRALAVILGLVSFIAFILGSLEAALSFHQNAPSKFGFILRFLGM